LILSNRGLIISEILFTISAVFSLIHPKSVAHATANAVIHAIINPIGHINNDKPLMIAGSANASQLKTAVNHATAVTIPNIVAVNSGFFSTQFDIFSIIGVTACNNLSTIGIKAFPIVFFIFSHCAFTLHNFSCIVSCTSHASSSSFFHCATTAFVNACFFSASVN
jgi:hypothetical protein